MNTVAMFLAQNGIIPSHTWHHDPKKYNFDGYTVAMFLAERNVVPSKEW